MRRNRVSGLRADAREPRFVVVGNGVLGQSERVAHSVEVDFPVAEAGVVAE